MGHIEQGIRLPLTITPEHQQVMDEALASRFTMKKTRSLNHNRFNAQLALAIIASASIAMTGCTTFKRKVGDNSLTIPKPKTLNPSITGRCTNATFTPVYAVPQSGENTLKITKKGKRFELPRPISTVK